MSVPSSANTFFGQVTGGTNLRDWQHASRIFIDSNYRLSPKYSFLFHMGIDLDATLAQSMNISNTSVLELGMMIKSFQLPRFTFDTKTFNAYNRVNIVQNKIKYEPITITLHDDSADVVREFWFSYMNYFYRDSDYQTNTYYQSHKYTTRPSQKWGYSPKGYGTASGNNEKLLKSIRLYSLHQKQFTEYQLINPIITGFQHGDHENGRNDTMQHAMTVSYEAVLYSKGYIKPDANINFATLHYDKTPSPLTAAGGGTQSILGPGGLLDSVDGIESQLGQGDLLGAGFLAGKAFTNFNGTNLGQVAGAEALQFGKDILAGNNPLNKVNVPTLSGLLASGAAPVGALTTVAGLFQTGPKTPTGATPNLTLAATSASGAGLAAAAGLGQGLAAGGPAATSNGDSLAASVPQPTMNTAFNDSGDQGSLA